MSIDIYNSRSTYHERCKWWKRNENDDYSSDELIMKRIPSGTFSAKEVAPLHKQDSRIAGVFILENQRITIKSPDNLEDISEKDLIEFRGEKWMVASVQRSKARNQNTFFGKDKYCSHYWYLELRK